MRVEKILCTVLHEAYKGQLEETMETFSEGLESTYQMPSLIPSILIYPRYSR